MAGPLEGIVPERAAANHTVWWEVMPKPARPGFVPAEFDNPFEMDVHFLRWLWRVRGDTGSVPLRIISDARESGGAPNSAHKSRPCRAVDLQVYNSHERAAILLAAVKHGCVRIGVYPGKSTDRGADQGGLHLDCSTEEQHAAPRVWTRF